MTVPAARINLTQVTQVSNKDQTSMKNIKNMIEILNCFLSIRRFILSLSKREYFCKCASSV